MTENEAIENLQDMYDVASCRIKNGDARGVIYIPPDKMDSFIVAITALKEIQQYREIGTVEECREARERRWIPVEKEWPPFGQRLQATILHHEWIADYDSYWVPEEEKTRHPAYMEVCEIYPMGEMWCYSCEEDKYEKDIAYINPAKVLSRPVAEIIAWRQLPELYRSGKDGEEHGRS